MRHVDVGGDCETPRFCLKKVYAHALLLTVNLIVLVEALMGVTCCSETHVSMSIESGQSVCAVH